MNQPGWSVKLHNLFEVRKEIEKWSTEDGRLRTEDGEPKAEDRE
jgi:hypothetical protein